MSKVAKTKFKETEIGAVPEEWDVFDIGDILTLEYGKALKKENRDSGKIPVYGSNGVVGFHNQKLVNGPGIIVGRKGSAGEVIFSKKDFFPIDTTYFVKTNLDNKYAYYLLKNTDIKQLVSSSAVPGLNRNDVYSQQIAIPKSENEQKQIAEILSCLDDKIELNRKINDNLEKIASSLFKHWFVDFEFPNEEGKPYKSSGGKMTDSELGEIPEGWRVGELGDVIERKNKKINQWKDKKIISLSAMPNFQISIDCFSSGKNFGTNINELNKFDILFGSIRPYFGKAGFSPISGGVAGTVFSYLPKDKNFYSYILFLTTSRKFIEYCVQNSKGTKMPVIGWQDFGKYKISMPELSIVENFNYKLLPLIEMMENNILENTKLSKIRDSLLSRLMSGRIRIK